MTVSISPRKCVELLDDDQGDSMSVETFADLMTNDRMRAAYMVQGADRQGWFWLESWARGATLSHKQWLRVHDVLAALFVDAEAQGVRLADQDAAADSYDDEALDRGPRKGPSQTKRLLVRARLFVGRGPAGE